MLVQNKKALVLGVANEKSLAWAIARRLRAEGAQVALGFGAPSSEKRALQLAQELAALFCLHVDVRVDSHWSNLNEALQAHGPFDIVVHSLAFADPEALAQGLLKATPEQISECLAISASSFVRLAQVTAPHLRPGASLQTLTNIGGERVIPGYGLMGVAKAALEASVRYLSSEFGPAQVRVNAISAGPVRTMSALGVDGFGDHYARARERAPLRENTTSDHVADAALYLASDLSRHVSGEVHFVDGGLHVLGA